MRHMEPLKDDILTSFVSPLAQEVIPPTAQAHGTSDANPKSPTLSLWQSGLHKKHHHSKGRTKDPKPRNFECFRTRVGRIFFLHIWNGCQRKGVTTNLVRKIEEIWTYKSEIQSFWEVSQSKPEYLRWAVLLKYINVLRKYLACYRNKLKNYLAKDHQCCTVMILERTQSSASAGTCSKAVIVTYLLSMLVKPKPSPWDHAKHETCVARNPNAMFLLFLRFFQKTFRRIIIGRRQNVWKGKI